ncbi:MAG: hypothetical protein FWH51_04635 [Dehalococcoidia bacterium]|nr:hypothetical protein [Dehalococcoidia bacterium]
MKKLCDIRILVATLLLVTLALASIACSNDVFTPPTAIILDEAPVEVVALDMWRDFQADPVAAAAKYGEKDLHFPSVRVDQMAFLGEPLEPELYVQEGIDPNIEQVRFRTDFLYTIINVREEYIVEIVGRYENLRYGYVNIRISWLRVIDPPGGDPNPPPEY